VVNVPDQAMSGMPTAQSQGSYYRAAPALPLPFRPAIPPIRAPEPAVASQIPSIGGLGAIIAVDFAIELALARDMFGDA
jgi:hypothetical protein